MRTNHKPKIKGTDIGIWRRIHYIPYLVTIADDDRDERFRETKLMPELPGILNRLLEGLRDYQLNGLEPPDRLQGDEGMSGRDGRRRHLDSNVLPQRP